MYNNVCLISVRAPPKAIWEYSITRTFFAPPLNIFLVNQLKKGFQFTFNWFQFIFNWFQLISIYFQLISIYFQLVSIYFQFPFISLISFTFNLLSIDLNLLLTYF